MLRLLVPLLAAAIYFAVSDALSAKYVNAITYLLLAIGIGMNCLVASANKWRMPVLRGKLVQLPNWAAIVLSIICFWTKFVPIQPGVHITAEPGTIRLEFLADRIAVHGLQLSPGDIFISLGLMVCIVWTPIDLALIFLRT